MYLNFIYHKHVIIHCFIIILSFFIGTGFELPQAAVKALQLTAQAQSSPMSGKPSVSVATKCFMLSNMFDPAK